MDFAAAMSAAMGKTKPAASSTSTSAPSQSKYLKRAELEAQREKDYLEEQAAAERARQEKQAQKRKREEEETERQAVRDEKRQRLAEESRRKREEQEALEEAERRKRLGLPPLPAANDKDEGAEVAVEEEIEEDELRAKLRALDEPTVLFAESHAARLKRYRVLTAPKVEWTKGPIPTTLKLLPEAEMRIPEKTPAKGPERDYVFRQLASYFTLVLTEWIRDLVGRDQEVQESSQGRQAFGAMEQSRENLRPLFRMFESGELKDEMLEPVMQIVRSAQARKYVDANNKYLELSIGKAAWPIGVVSVGIHARASRSRIGEERENVAHIMGDEISRRWLQAIKRCITYAQTRWPPDDQMQLMG